MFAEIKLAGQENYIDSLFGLWIDTACVEDIAKPLYYVTTGNGLSEADLEAGYKYFLVNPYDSVYTVDATTGYGDLNSNSLYWNDSEFKVKVISKASVWRRFFDDRSREPDCCGYVEEHVCKSGCHGVYDNCRDYG